ncbi:MAG: hypothetical protein ACLPUO_15065 [Streptosporangiaceae bacterium]|jgi:hypothetical protein
MLLPGALFALVTVGFVVPCLIDAARTPRYYFAGTGKGTWLTAIALLWAFGAVAWLIAGRPRRGRPTAALPGRAAGTRGLSPQEALRRHPAWRSMQAGDGTADPAADAAAGLVPLRPAGPDDDPEFLTKLARRIRDARGD